MDVLRRVTALVFFAALAGCVGPRAASETNARARAKHREVELASVMHTVEKGETIFRIALGYGLAADDVMAANGIRDPRTLAVGQQLVIPGANKRLVIKEEAPRAARLMPARPPAPSARVLPPSRPRPGPAVPARPSAPGRPVPPASQLEVGKGSGALAWPLRGVLYGRYGRRGSEPHDGIDLAAPKGTPVRTAAAGKVVFAGEQRGYGLLVIVDHGSDLVTLYAHNNDLRVHAGQQVRAGQVIATVGESGRTSGPHLHFEVRKNGLPVDPLAHLGPVPSS